jgi:hypothetical protein
MKRSEIQRRTPLRSSSTIKAAEPKPPKGPKPKRCANRACRQPYIPDPKQPWKNWHSDDCALVIALDKLAKQKAAKAKKERADDRAKRATFKRRPAYVAEAQTAFNAFIRERDKDLPCICCGSFKASGEKALHGGGWDAGHYISRGHASHLRFDERNVHKQRKGCNKPGGSTRAKYRAGLVRRYGEQYVAELEALEYIPPTRDFTIDELVKIRDTYRAKLRELQKGAA